MPGRLQTRRGVLRQDKSTWHLFKTSVFNRAPTSQAPPSSKGEELVARIPLETKGSGERTGIGALGSSKHWLRTSPRGNRCTAIGFSGATSIDTRCQSGLLSKEVPTMKPALAEGGELQWLEPSTSPEEGATCFPPSCSTKAESGHCSGELSLRGQGKSTL